MRLRAARVLAAVVAPLVACHSGPTGPGSATATHPTGTAMSRRPDLAGRPFGIRVSIGGDVYVTQQDLNSVARYRLDDPAPSQAIVVGGDPGDVVFSRGGATAFVSNFYDGTVNVLDVAAGRSIKLLHVDPGNAYRLALSSDDSLLYVTSTSGRLYAVDVRGSTPTRSIQLGGALQGIALQPDAGSVVVSNTAGLAWRLDARTLDVLASRQVGAGAQDVAASPDGTRLFVAIESGTIRVLDATTLQTLESVVTTGLSPFGLAVTPDGAQLYVTSPTNGLVGVYDRAAGASIKLYPVGGVPRRIAFDASGATALISNEGNWVDVIR
ncbi:MAG: YncE family protein [Gemmatimonadaceae bacterium]|nr:YncE family protein [Gemmatimonadaceae bacterium]NUO95178.1 YncE family protein [Gemmatimonadaceae bacterium]NUP56486.1 YncE family protein [Gemmatimonadaceae bacterium]NUR34671.1 YncE family protein [Gemmatimonadaceae bacterium]NUS46764.1 YncE family protein [Gemmatimonadaceae bacterium]